MVSKYTCQKEGCSYIKELTYVDREGLEEIFDHEKTHRKNTREVIHKEREPCERCDGKGYLEYAYTVDEDVSETD